MIDLDALLEPYIDESYRDFHAALVPGKTLKGIRTPDLERIAKTLDPGFLDEPLQDTYEYSVLYGMKCADKRLDPEQHIRYLTRWLATNDNWAANDLVSSRQKWIRKYKKEMIPTLEKWHQTNEPWKQRFVYTLLLMHYKETKDEEVIFDFLSRPFVQEYYVQMAVAWLLCEMLIRSPERTETFLDQSALDPFTKQKAFQKAVESRRIGYAKKQLYRQHKKKLVSE